MLSSHFDQSLFAVCIHLASLGDAGKHTALLLNNIAPLLGLMVLCVLVTRHRAH